MSSTENKQQAEERDIWVDPVSHEPVDRALSRDQSFYAHHMYHFVSRSNKQTFDADPELWISTPHSSPTSAALSPIGEG